MYLDANEWPAFLHTKVHAKGLLHLDVLIDGTLFSESQRESFAALEPRPLQALLFEQTPEHASKALGPLLVRLQLDTETHTQWLRAFTQQSYKKAGALNLLSRWAFPELAAHLRDCTQACSVVLGLTGQAQLMAHSPETLEFIRLRNTYLDPLHLLQAELLARSRRQQAAQDSPLEQALLVTVAGIAAGLRNTG